MVTLSSGAPQVQSIEHSRATERRIKLANTSNFTALVGRLSARELWHLACVFSALPKAHKPPPTMKHNLKYVSLRKAGARYSGAALAAPLPPPAFTYLGLCLHSGPLGAYGPWVAICPRLWPARPTEHTRDVGCSSRSPRCARGDRDGGPGPG